MFVLAAVLAMAIPSALAQSGAVATQAVSKLAFPPSRGSNPLVSNIGPCQGYEVGGRIDYPITGGRVSWTNVRDIKNAQLAVSSSSNPTQQSDFVGVGQNVTRSWVGSQCINGPDFAALGYQVGQQVTLQHSWQAGPGNYPGYECADLNLVSAADFAAGNWTVTCNNLVAGTQQRSSANPTLTRLQAEQAAESASANSSTGLTVTQAGVIGAMVTLAVTLAALGLAYAAGVAVFGKAAKRAKRDQRTRASNDKITEKTISSASSA